MRPAFITKATGAAALIAMAAMTAISLAAAAVAQEEKRPLPEADNAPDAYVVSVSAYGPDRNRKATHSIEIKNTGKKVITAIDWEYVSEDVRGPVRGYAIARLRNEKLRINPGEKQKMSRQIDYDQKLVAGFRVSKIRIMRVEFEDGSAWERELDKGANRL